MQSNFDQIFVLYSPSVYSTGDVISTYVYREGLGAGEFSYSTAVGLFESLVGFGLLVTANWVTRRITGNTLVRSLSANSAILSGRVYLWPVGLNLEGYQTLFRDALFFVSLRNTLFTTTVGTALRLAVTLLAGYAFSKNNLVGRKALFLVFLLTMFFEGGIVPTFIIVRNLGLYDTLWALVLIEAAKVST